MQDVNKHIPKIVNTADIQCMLGVSARSAQRRMKKLKDATGKQKHHLVTLNEFMRYYRIEQIS